MIEKIAVHQRTYSTANGTRLRTDLATHNCRVIHTFDTQLLDIADDSGHQISFDFLREDTVDNGGFEDRELIMTVDGGCPSVANIKSGVIGATSQQNPLLMASLGIGALNKGLRDHLRTKRQFRQSRLKTQKTSGPISDPLPIKERPAEVEDRAIPGHWEGYLIADEGNQSPIATLVERNTRFVMLVRVRSKETQEVTRAIARQVRKLPDELCKTLTWDNGSEMVGHRALTLESGVDIFVDPYNLWQRGSNGNTNRLLRQYYPIGTGLSGYTQPHLNKVAAMLLVGHARRWVSKPAGALQQVLKEAAIAPTG